ncbi:acyl carrier protein [Streptomyces syringium]|uniref:acyl carrier protein n=1 Tax=Streptomyces syringium TaxID=76729 RepID=UPI00341EF8C1
MTSPLYEPVKDCLTRHFNLDAGQIHPESTLEGLGLDSLALVEFSCVLQDEVGLAPLAGTDTPADIGTMTLTQFVTALEELQHRTATPEAETPAPTTQAPS